MSCSNNSQRQAPPIYDNSFYRRRIIRPLAKRLSPFLVRKGFSANGVCWLKFAAGLIGAVLLSSKSPVIGFIGMLGLQMNFLLDAADGGVARLRGGASPLFGGYFDKILAR
ncbi:MAG: CDP-alcohol phosphatidyltransferase family protein, partial [FCB group bacterium]|nr:CDP-alcohol phosphatidyltransferase family protein [FCB group bacterium]